MNPRSTLEGFRVARVRWQPSRSRIAQSSQIRFGLGITFALLIAQIENGPRLEGDPFLQGLVCSKIVDQERVLSDSLCPFRPGEMPPMACPISWVGKFTGCAARLGEELLIASTAGFIDELLSITLPSGSRASDRVLHIACMFKTVAKCTEQLGRPIDASLGSLTLIHRPKF